MPVAAALCAAGRDDEDDRASAAEVQAGGVVAQLVQAGHQFEAGEMETTLRDAHAILRRSGRAGRERFFAQRWPYIAELPADDERWDLPESAVSG